MSNKKKKKEIAKRRAQAKGKKRHKAKASTHRSKPNVQFINRPAISEISVPAGFRAVGMSQAIVEYSKPIMDFVEKGVVNDHNDALQLAMPLWNINFSQNRDNPDNIKKDIIKQIRKTLKINSQESAEFFDMMIQRKDHLFPTDIQPDNPMTMYIRKEEHCPITEFNYDSLNISEEPYLLDDEDKKLVQLINQMDKYIAEGVVHDEWEDHYLSMEEKCKERFKKWLAVKGVKEYCEDFPMYIKIYLNFIYRYMHDDKINLKTVLPIYIEEFFVDYVLRKVTVEPSEYIEWPPALKLLYKFLYEIVYLEKPEIIIKLLDRIEPHFIKVLRKIYS